MAELLAAQGAGVVVNGRDADAASEAAQRITGAVAHPGSAAQPAVAEALIDTCVREFGQIDILVNCAGTAGLASESIFNEAGIETAIDTSAPEDIGMRSRTGS